MGNNDSTSSHRSTNRRTTQQAFGSSKIASSRLQGTARILQDFQLIWLDQTIDEENNRDCQKNMIELCRTVNSIRTFTDENQCVTFLSETRHEKAFIIISGSFGRKTVPQIHDMSNVLSIFIFCGNISLHQEWAKGWPKINGVFRDILQICEALQEILRQCERNTIPMSVTSVNTNDTTTNKKLNKFEPSFIYTQILKEILLTIEFEEHHFNEFIDYFRKSYPQKHHKNMIEQFKQEYRSKTPIWCYSRDSFLYPRINRALRAMDINDIIKMGFFVRDLHRHLEQLHNEQFGSDQNKEPFTVFRGQGLPHADLKEIQENNGGLISFNSFLSTSRKYDVSKYFADQSLYDENLVGVVFVMRIDPTLSTVPFASIKDVSFYGGKEDDKYSSRRTRFFGSVVLS